MGKNTTEGRKERRKQKIMEMGPAH